jgi:hypothetical protein
MSAGNSISANAGSKAAADGAGGISKNKAAEASLLAGKERQRWFQGIFAGGLVACCALLCAINLCCICTMPDPFAFLSTV